MAIIRNGKTQGRIKNLVYRVVDGVEIVQPYTRNIQQTEKTKRASVKFAKSSKMGSEVYKQLKEFASNFTTVKTFREIVSLLRGSIYLHDEQSKLELLEKSKLNFEEKKSEITVDTFENPGWSLIENTDLLPINKEAILSDFLNEKPIATFSELECKIQIPEFQYNTQGGKHPTDANYVEFFASVYHSNSNGTYSLCDFGSGRLAIGAGFPAQSVILPFEWFENIEREGVVSICFGMSFYAQEDSRMHINSSRFNPSVVLGLWYKED